MEKRWMGDKNDQKENEKENIERTLMTKGKISFPDSLGAYCHVFIAP
jgi:hypothetical protein